MRLIEYDIDSSTTLAVEAPDELQPGATVRASGGNQIVRSGKSLDEALGGIRPLAQKLLEQVKGLAPQEVEIEFGIKLSGETGVILAKASAEGHCKFILRWKQ